MSFRFKETPEVSDSYRWFVLGISAFVMIAAARIASGQQPTSMAADTSLLSAILKAAIADPEGGKWDLRVDPRPLIAQGEIGIYPETLAPVSALVVRQRTAVIHAAGLRTGDAMKEYQNTECRGVFVRDQRDSLGHLHDVHAGCPMDTYDLLAIGLPRPGSAVLGASRVYDRDTGAAARGYWAAQVIRTTLGRGGSSQLTSDYVLARRAGTWVVVKIVGLIYSE
ncbi:MAG: hypothetical protein ABIQ55_06615 [Gemmatimonadaceae bacterium]